MIMAGSTKNSGQFGSRLPRLAARLLGESPDVNLIFYLLSWSPGTQWTRFSAYSVQGV
jgi:hypothetical protein